MDDLRTLSADLSSAGGRVGAKVSQVVRKTALDIEADAKRRSAVDTGAMRSSIGHDLKGDGRNAAMTADIGPTVEYAPHVEYGTVRQAPQPFMRPAADAAEAPFAAAIAAASRDVV